MELTIKIPNGLQSVGITGPKERNLKIIREALGVNIIARDSAVHISGDNDQVSQAARIIEKLSESAKNQSSLDSPKLLELIASISRKNSLTDTLSGNNNMEYKKEKISKEKDNVQNKILESGANNHLDVYLSGRRVRPLTKGQKRYLECLQNFDLTFCSGPAGTGKTYLAVAGAISMLKRGEVRKLVLVRPAVEAGEKLGFLPGSMQEKVNPYLRPLLDALGDMMEFDQLQRFMACDLIEIVPLAFMRGRTLNDALVILDEAQNTTKSQMLMFLTRLGHGSKMIVTGDTSQIDLEEPRESGLVDAVHRLRHTKGIAMATLDSADIVRHNLVQRVIEAYE